MRMSRLDTYVLTHPESLSQDQLREILRNSCIESHKFEKLCRSELLEMYKQIALPLPQRQRGNSRSSSIVDVISQKSATVSDNSTSNLTDLNRGNKRTMSFSHTDKLKSSFNDQKPVNKKTRLCSVSKVEVECNGIYKRSCEEQREELSMKKRQKITWP
ncbi:uncharacterized protein LOC105831201 [Monomorium pharaonis]|uniref:uncharacterized protein LOC105831201 n=1 Tax=Monomorium pharaonis TaxID=307658 RepID=UPI00063FB4D3|nr:uncharacterized protein LOC105831201 [Monomorium pharaonis]